MNEVNQHDRGKRSVPVLFASKVDCCACGACVNACPRGAITMKEDSHGYLYPHIDESLCISCGKCKKVCAFQNKEETNTPLFTYAARARDCEVLAASSSGGVFAAVAKEVIRKGGVVFGAAYTDGWDVRHIPVEREADLIKLQGSKYTQSATADAYSQAKTMLEAGRTVLYSGTPCQIAGLYGFLGKNYEGLLTMDLICHGVPNTRMLREYLSGLAKREKAEVTGFTFRDKRLGWGINGSADLRSKGRVYRKRLWSSEESYISYFLKGWIYRENCYQCKYACAHRPADITIGDYWGIESAHPDYLRNGWSDGKGISVIIVNTEKGRACLDHFGSGLVLRPSDFEKARAGNHNLQAPTSPGKREEILETYAQGGWPAVEQRFRKRMGLRIYAGRVKNLIPKGMKRTAKRVIQMIKR